MKTTIKTRAFDAAEYLRSEESIAAFVGDALESGDAVVIQSALGTAARARGMAQIADASGLGRESLYKALRPDAKPRFDTVLKVIAALGIKVSVEPAGRQPIARAAGKRVRPAVQDTKFVKVVGHAASKPYKSAKAPAKKVVATKRTTRHA